MENGGYIMYEVEEFYSSNGQDLKELLKTCIFNYYINRKLNHFLFRVAKIPITNKTNINGADLTKNHSNV